MNNWLAYFACTTILEFTSYDKIFTVFMLFMDIRNFLNMVYFDFCLIKTLAIY